VMVLFLFVIMLLDLKEEEKRRIRLYGVVAACVSVGALLWMFLSSLARSLVFVSETPSVEGGTAELGTLLFTRYLLPFEVVSVLLLVAMIGVVLLSKKDLK
jgi:NADH-quinone oxidoreductase subunit J